MEKYVGKSVSGNACVGKVFFFNARKDDFANETTDDVEMELKMLSRATLHIGEIFENRMREFVRQGRKMEADVTQAHGLILTDANFQERCRRRIQEEHASARRAVSEAGNELCMFFENMDDDLVRERATDIRGVVEQLLSVLGGEKQQFPKLEEPVILVADELTPEGALCFEKDKILGMIINNGTYYSHCSILARLWNIPALVGICPDESWAGRVAAIDGVDGVFCLEPDQEMLDNVKEHEYKDIFWG